MSLKFRFLNLDFLPNFYIQKVKFSSTQSIHSNLERHLGIKMEISGFVFTISIEFMFLKAVTKDSKI